jgi:TrbC/VIRB2 family.
MMFKRIGIWEVVIGGLFVIAMMLAIDPVYAATGSTQGGGSGLPMEIYTQRIIQALTGPVAYGFVLLMFMGAGIRWHRAGDFGDVGVGFLTLGIVGSLVVASAQFVSILYSGALIDDDTAPAVPCVLVLFAWSYALWIVKTKAAAVDQGRSK